MAHGNMPIWQHSNIAKQRHGNKAMTAWQWQHGNGNMAVATWQKQHGKGIMAVDTWQRQHGTVQP